MDDAWSQLAPHRPLLPGAAEYAQRPKGSGDDLAAAVRAGWRRIAVVGPMGVGKSTELAAAEESLSADRLVFRIGIDRTFDMRRIQAGQVFVHVLAKFLETRPNPEGERGFAPEFMAGDQRELRRDLARKALRAAGNATLLVDGLEKADEASARAVAEELFALGDDADIVLVVPASLAYGPGAAILGEDVRLFPVRPVLVWGLPAEDAQRGRIFLRDLALRHLGRPSSEPSLDRLLKRASVAGGGVPRVMLQLLRDARRHAVVAGRSRPSEDDLIQAERDHGEQLRRSLLPGDVDALIKAEGTDGTEVPLDRKLRFLLQGHLLEYERGDRIVVSMAPTLAAALRFFQQELTQELLP